MPNRDDYEQLIQPLEQQMLLTIGRLVRDPDRAADVLQDAMTRIWFGLDRLKVHPNPQAYVLSVCISAAHDMLRKMKRIATAQQAMVAEGRVRTGGPEPSAVLAEREVEQAVLNAISWLPVQQATAVLMRLIHEKPFADIAEALGCEESTARTHYARGRASLARDLARYSNASDATRSK